MLLRVVGDHRRCGRQSRIDPHGGGVGIVGVELVVDLTAPCPYLDATGIGGKLDFDVDVAFRLRCRVIVADGAIDLGELGDAFAVIIERLVRARPN